MLVLTLKHLKEQVYAVAVTWYYYERITSIYTSVNLKMEAEFSFETSKLESSESLKAYSDLFSAI
jgi:hypothetical protein